MIAAEELGVLLENVFVTTADTDMTTDTGSTSGSRQTITGGTGVKLAAADAKNQLLDVAASELKADKKDLSIRDSMVYVAGSDKGIPLDRIAAKMPGGVIFGRGVHEDSDKRIFPHLRGAVCRGGSGYPQRPCQGSQDRGGSRSRQGNQPADGRESDRGRRRFREWALACPKTRSTTKPLASA